MIGYIVTQEIADAILTGIDAAMDSRGLPRYWTTGSYPIIKGPNQGLIFIPADDQILNTPLQGNPPMRPVDFPEFYQLVEMLGGLDARVEIASGDITPDNMEEL